MFVYALIHHQVELRLMKNLDEVKSRKAKSVELRHEPMQLHKRSVPLD